VQAEIVHGGQWKRAARGIAGQFNVRLFLAFTSSYHEKLKVFQKFSRTGKLKENEYTQ